MSKEDWEMEDSQDEAKPSDTQCVVTRPYTPPQLIRYGNITELTNGGAFTKPGDNEFGEGSADQA